MINPIISGIVATFDRDNIDTDQIIPTEYLKSIKKFGFGDFLFDGWRYLDEGRLDMTSEDRSKNYDFILNISEDGWFGNSIGPHQHYSHSIFRSIEEGKTVIRSSNNGISAFINPKGQVIDKILTTDRGFIEVKTFKKSDKTIFNSHGNKIFFYFLSIYISLIFFFKIRGN